MTQSRTASLIESVFNVVIGYGVALASQIVIFPMFGIHLPLSDNLAIGAWFTIISLVRSYAIRRWFNARLHRAEKKIAGFKLKKKNLRGRSTSTATAFLM
jgi:membrane protein implicated in regulation of membrane protease activity